MKIFVTGSSGFIGGHFINAVPNEVEIISLRRNKSKNKILFNREIKWIEKEFYDLTSKDLSGVDAIFHFASVGVSPQEATWQELYDFNVICTLTLLRMAKEAGVRRFIMAGSYL